MTTREILWIRAAISAAVTWAQRKTASDGAEEITQHSDRSSGHVLLEDIPETDERPAHQAPRYRYAKGEREAIEAAVVPVFGILNSLYGAKWAVHWFHYDLVGDSVQFRRKRQIDTMTDEVTEETKDPRVLEAAAKAADQLAAILTAAHGHPIELAQPPAPVGDAEE